MVDLVCLVADRNMEAAVAGLLKRPSALGIRSVKSELIVHPERDPGCFHRGVDFLRSFRSRAAHALVMLDFDWQGVPAASAPELEDALEAHLARAGMGDWARAVVIEPELEAWVFGPSSHVSPALGWTEGADGLRAALADKGLWPVDLQKPPDPKASMEWALKQVRRPRSSSIYRELAANVGTRKCTDRAFVRFRGLLQDWFPPSS